MPDETGVEMPRLKEQKAAMRGEVNAKISELEASGAIKPTTKVCILLVGEGKATELSPTMHNAAYRKGGDDLLYIKSGTNDLKGIMEEMHAPGSRIRGASVGIPYKQEVMKYLDFVDPTAREIGAVNTIVNNNGRLEGYNSDWIGAQAAMLERRDAKAKLRTGAKAVVIGAGGAGMALTYMLKKNGVDVTVYSRDPEHAKSVAEKLGVRCGGGLDALASAGRVDIIVNTTSVGSKVGGHAGESAVPASLLEKNSGAVAFDAVYLPHETRFLLDAKAAGLTPVYGDRMLLFQAGFQVEKFASGKAPVREMEAALNEYLKSLGSQQ